MKSTAPASRRPRAWAAMIGAVALIPLALGALVVSQPTQPAGASSHREAPFISSDPEADNTDLYAFVSPDMTNTVTIVANYIPLEEPNGGPNFASFGDNVLYEIRVDNTGNGEADVVYQFRFNTQLRNPNTFLYNTGPITSLDSANWNMPQFYSVTRLEGNTSQVLGANLKTPPVNVGPRSTPNYDTLASAAINSIGGRKFFAGQRDDPFFVDLGSIFDLGGLRPFNSLHLIPLANTAGVDGLKGFNTHSIVMQVPITDLTRDHQMPTGPGDPRAVLGVWATASRQAVRVLRHDGSVNNSGPWVQISRLGNPLINEVVIPLGQKDYWNATYPSGDKQFVNRYLNPELTGLENLLYPALDDAATTGRADLVQILLTGIPGLNFTGNAKADMLRLNMAVPPSASPDRMGAMAGQLDGFPNGRRLGDDVTDIELRATAEGYGPILHSLLGLPDRTPNDLIGDGVDSNDKPFMSSFPYVASPWQGYDPAHHNVTPPGVLKAERMLNP
jgi:hypothetical protein